MGMKQQQQLSQQQLYDIQHKLSQITRIQKSQDAQQQLLDKQRRELEAQQKQQLLEQHIQIQSLSDNQMLTQKQLLEAHHQIQATRQQTQSVNDNIQSLQQLQHQQAVQQQLTEQQIQQQINDQTQQLQTQQQLTQLAQIAAAQQSNFQAQITQIPQLPPLQQPTNNKPWMQMPSFFTFGGGNKPNLTVADMDTGKEEKRDILIDDDDDDDVLGWSNDYGQAAVVHPIYQNPKLLKTKGIVGEGKFMPNECRECGWILRNKSKVVMKISAKLVCLGGDKEEYGMRIKTEKEYEFSLKPEEDIYILIEVKAPGIVGKYCAFYQLMIDDGSVKVGEMLELLCDVQAQFNKQKETKIEQIIKMGFDDRKKVIAMLQKKKWNVQQSFDTLIGM